MKEFIIAVSFKFYGIGRSFQHSPSIEGICYARSMVDGIHKIWSRASQCDIDFMNETSLFAINTAIVSDIYGIGTSKETICAIYTIEYTSESYPENGFRVQKLVYKEDRKEEDNGRDGKSPA